jgi:hypothetical protein
MNLRADHVAGAAFVAFGLLVIALSGDLPTGQLSMPGSGFMPKIVAVLMILFGLALAARAGVESGPMSDISWSDGKHAVMVIVIAAIATMLYTVAGFIITMVAMLLALLLVIERRAPLRAVIYSLSVVLVTYSAFEFLLRTPLPESPWSY